MLFTGDGNTGRPAGRDSKSAERGAGTGPRPLWTSSAILLAVTRWFYLRSTAHPVGDCRVQSAPLTNNSRTQAKRRKAPTLHPSALFFWPGRGPFSFRQGEKKMVGADPRGSLPQSTHHPRQKKIKAGRSCVPLSLRLFRQNLQ